MYATRRARQQAAMEVVAPAPLIPVEHFDAAKLSPVAHHDHSAEMRFREIPQAAPQQAQTQENKDAGEMRFTETNAKAQTEAQTEAQTQAAATAEAKQGVKFIGKIRKFGQRLTGSDLKNHAQLIEGEVEALHTSMFAATHRDMLVDVNQIVWVAASFGSRWRWIWALHDTLKTCKHPSSTTAWRRRRLPSSTKW